MRTKNAAPVFQLVVAATSKRCHSSVLHTSCVVSNRSLYHGTITLVRADTCYSVLCEPRRFLFQSKKTFLFPDEKLTQDEHILREASQILFLDDRNAEVAPENVKLPSAQELDRFLPSLQQLREEIPSAAAAEELFGKSNVSPMCRDEPGESWDDD
ncbi:hypothetical protein TRVL_06705 [Trypanosoma vivax]|nr:hypothetical protein TRVL_06705 [Trypanosoma vivax]